MTIFSVFPQLQICINAHANPDAARAATRLWFDLGLRHLAADLWAEAVQDREDDPWLDPEEGAVACSFSANVKLHGPQTFHASGIEGLPGFLRQAETLPGMSGAHLHSTYTRVAGQAPPSYLFTAVRIESASPWMLLNVNCPPEIAQTEAGQDRIVDFMLKAASAAPPAFGRVGGKGSVWESAVESALQINPLQTIPLADNLLRGYGWITIISDRMVGYLGGTHRLADSGAFAKVVRLERGGYWLQATDQWQGYDESAAEAVWRVLAPLLPAGLPINIGRPGEPITPADARTLALG